MRERVINILSELRPEFDFNGAVNYIEEGMLDSFDIINLVTALDEAFGISIDGIDVLPENFLTLDKIIALIEKNKGA